MVETQFIGDDDEIPMWKRDKLWKRNLLAAMMKFQCESRDRLWKHNLLAMKMKFQGEIETDCGNTIY